MADMIVNLPTPPMFDREDDEGKDNTQSLISFLVPRLDEWRNWRENNYDSKWEEFYRLWRGIWHTNDKVRDAERSRLISPALQQAIEAQVSEFEEATFSRNRWFLILDDLMDTEPEDVESVSSLLLEDLERDKVKSAISECYLNAALYGTGIGKIVLTKEKIINTVQGPEGPEPVRSNRLAVKMVPVDPFEFLIDPAAKTIDDGMGAAHEMLVPRHTVLEKQDAGIYRDVPLGTWEQDHSVFIRSGEQNSQHTDGRIKITEYYGLVPLSYLEEENKEESEEDEFIQALLPNQTSDGLTVQIDHMEMVEAWVTMANDSIILRAQRNPFLKGDRPFVAYQHDTVPNRFWGRGVAEKGYNVQKALDGELRARMDNLALSTYPMLAMDSNAFPRDGKFQVRPGRTVLVNGDPNSVIREFRFSEPGPASFRETADLERMIQVATGSMDSASPIGVSPRNQTASGMSMISTGAMKRMKRTLQNIERDFLNPLLHKIAQRYMQFNPERYPSRDFVFRVKSGLGLVARELEQSNLTQLLQTAQPGSPSYFMILKNIWNLSAVESREEMVEITNKLLEQSMKPPEPPPPTVEEQLKMEEIQLDKKKQQLDELKFEWERAMDIATYRNEQRKTNQRSTEYAIDMQRVEAQRPQFEATAFEKVASAIDKLSTKGSGEGEVNQSISELRNELNLVQDILNKQTENDESTRGQASEEFMALVRDLEARIDTLTEKEPATKMLQGTSGPQGPEEPRG